MVDNTKASCVALGNFDGIHIGHDVLINKMIDISHIEKQNSIIVTFRFVDKNLKKSSTNLKYINNLETKIAMLKSYGVTDVVDIELDEIISKYTPEQFIRTILIEKLNVKNIIVGYNFRFGYKATGDVSALRQYGDDYGYKVIEIPPIKYNGIAVSSTLIRNLIREGKICDANSLLIEKYFINFHDIEIDHNKNKGFVNNNKSIVIPSDGIYNVKVGSATVKLSICNTADKAIFTFDKKIEKNENIIFLS